jgi:hypothetical protein
VTRKGGVERVGLKGAVRRVFIPSSSRLYSCLLQLLWYTRLPDASKKESSALIDLKRDLLGWGMGPKDPLTSDLG